MDASTSTPTTPSGEATPSSEVPRKPARPPYRQEIESGNTEVLLRRKWGNADLLILDLGDGPQVIKDFRHKPWLTRTMGRILIRHECRAYRWLGDMPGIPTFIGQVDPWALSLVKIDGVLLTEAEYREAKGEIYLERLREQITRFMGRGFFHFDMRGRRNVMLCESGKVIVLDLAGALWFDPTGPTAPLWRPLLGLFYETVEIKWRTLLTPTGLSGRDRKRLKRLNRLRTLWFLNPKGKPKKKTRGSTS